MKVISKNLKISASILAADFNKLGDQILQAQDAGCDEFHFDVMDGHFVPGISMGPVVLNPLMKFIKIPVEVHLMVKNPRQFIAPFSEIGVNLITFHIETANDPMSLIKELKNSGMKVGVAKNPKTPSDAIIDFIEEVDRVLVMCVEPGSSGQKFDEKKLDDINRINDSLIRKNLKGIVDLSVDGGINSETIINCRETGADTFVSGSSIFWSGDVHSNVSLLKKSLGI